MHHRHTSPPLSARLAGTTSRIRLRTAAGLRRGRGRFGLAVVLMAMMTGFVLAAPVATGQGSSPDVDPTASRSDSPVVMGVDGRLGSSAFASASARLTIGPDGVRVESSGRNAADRAAAAPPVTPSPEPAPAPAPAPVEAPAPAPAPPAAVEEPAPAPTRTSAPAAQAAVPTPPAPVGGGREGEVLALVNQERAAAGCRPLTADAGLASVAAAHSADMRDRGFFDHVNLSGQDPFDRASAAGVTARAENIARGQADPAEVMQSWMNSPGHRANILDCSLTRLGVGIADGGGGPWWTQLFG